MPYKSRAQQRFFHSRGARRAGISEEMVREWDSATATSKGGYSNLPERKTQTKKAGLIALTKQYLDERKKSQAQMNPQIPKPHPFNQDQVPKLSQEDLDNLVPVRDPSSGKVIGFLKSASMTKEAISTKAIKRMAEAFTKNPKLFEHKLVQQSDFSSAWRGAHGGFDASVAKQHIRENLTPKKSTIPYQRLSSQSRYNFGGSTFNPTEYNNIKSNIDSHHGAKMENYAHAHLYEMDSNKVKEDYLKPGGEEKISPPTGHIAKDLVHDKELRSKWNPNKSYDFEELYKKDPNIMHDSSFSSMQRDPSFEQAFHKQYLQENIKSHGTIFEHRKKDDLRLKNLQERAYNLYNTHSKWDNRANKYVSPKHFEDLTNLAEKKNTLFKNKVNPPSNSFEFNRTSSSILDHKNNRLPEDVYIKSTGGQKDPTHFYGSETSDRKPTRWVSRNLGVSMDYAEINPNGSPSFHYQPSPNQSSTRIQDELKRKGFLKSASLEKRAYNISKLYSEANRLGIKAHPNTDWRYAAKLIRKGKIKSLEDIGGASSELINNLRKEPDLEHAQVRFTDKDKTYLPTRYFKGSPESVNINFTGLNNPENDSFGYANNKAKTYLKNKNFLYHPKGKWRLGWGPQYKNKMTTPFNYDESPHFKSLPKEYQSSMRNKMDSFFFKPLPTMKGMSTHTHPYTTDYPTKKYVLDYIKNDLSSVLYGGASLHPKVSRIYDNYHTKSTLNIIPSAYDVAEYSKPYSQNKFHGILSQTPSNDLIQGHYKFNTRNENKNRYIISEPK